MGNVLYRISVSKLVFLKLAFLLTENTLLISILAKFQINYNLRIFSHSFEYRDDFQVYYCMNLYCHETVSFVRTVLNLTLVVPQLLKIILNLGEFFNSKEKKSLCHIL